MNTKIKMLLAVLALSVTPACKESKANDAQGEKSDKKEEGSTKSESKKEDKKEEAKKEKKALGVKVSAIKPTIESDYAGKGKYVKVAFEVTANQKLEGSHDLRVKILCNVKDEKGDDKKMSEKPSTFINFAELGKGETKKTDVTAWVIDPLAKAPSACTLTFQFGELLSDDAETVTEVCFKPSTKAVTDGACD